jgi:hypothetical protein
MSRKYMLVMVAQSSDHQLSFCGMVEGYFSFAAPIKKEKKIKESMNGI